MKRNIAILMFGGALAAACGNTSPFLDAGEDANALVDEVFEFSPKGHDDDGDIIKYLWEMTSKPAGSAAELDDPSRARATFTPDLEGAYEFSVTSTDGDSVSGPDTVTITARLAPAPAIAPFAAAILPGETLTLDGSESTVASVGTISYAWSVASRPERSAFELKDQTAATVDLKPDVDGEYEIELTIGDGEFEKSEIVKVIRRARPLATIAARQLVFVGEQLELDGSESVGGPGSEELKYTWAIAANPEGSQVQLTSTTANRTSFVAPMPGEYTISLVVNDGLFESEPAELTITAVARE